MRFTLMLPLLLAASAALAEPSIKAPATASAGSQLSLEATGAGDGHDFVTVVQKGAPEGSYDQYVYIKPGKLVLQLPAKPGDYELRVCAAASPYKTLARQPLRIEGATATVKAPTAIKAGALFEVAWTAPNNPRDYITIGNTDSKYLDYKYTSNGSPAKLTAPDKAGEYEVRYILGQGDTIIATQKVTVGAVSASVTVPAQVAAGAKVSVGWQGPGNPRDYITIVKSGAAEQTWGRYEYLSKGNPVPIVAPDAPGEYEVRYLTAQTNTTLARAPLTVGAVTGTLTGPARWLPVIGSRSPGKALTIRATSSLSLPRARAKANTVLRTRTPPRRPTRQISSRRSSRATTNCVTRPPSPITRLPALRSRWCRASRNPERLPSRRRRAR
jgi:hypothetical protein